MRLHAAALAVFTLAALARVYAANDAGTENFVMEAAKDGMHEVAIGKMAAEKAGHARVKQLGQTLVDDHTKSNEELKQIAGKLGMDLSGVNHSLDHDADLSKLSGAEFDRAFLKMVMNDHQKSIASFERYSKEGTNADVKNFAAKHLPHLQHHLELTQRLSAELGRGAELDMPQSEQAADASLQNENAQNVSIDERKEADMTYDGSKPADLNVDNRNADLSVNRSMMQEHREFRSQQPADLSMQHQGQLHGDLNRGNLNQSSDIHVRDFSHADRNRSVDRPMQDRAILSERQSFREREFTEQTPAMEGRREYREQRLSSNEPLIESSTDVSYSRSPETSFSVSADHGDCAFNTSVSGCDECGISTSFSGCKSCEVECDTCEGSAAWSEPLYENDYRVGTSNWVNEPDWDESR